MRKVIFILCAMFSLTIQAQTVKKHSINPEKSDIVMSLSRADSVLTLNNGLLERIEKSSYSQERYKLYQTENIYTLLELDTKTGKIQQVQWSLDEDNEFCVTVNDNDLSYGLDSPIGSFELYPTKNIYQFILLNKTNGCKWHVQWGMSDSKRWIRFIH